MSLCLLSYLVGVLDCVSAISCGPDAVTCPVTGRIITPLPHDIAQMLTSPHLNHNLSNLLSSSSLFLLLLLPSFLLFSFLFPPLEMRSTLVFYARFCCVHLGNEGHHSSSAFACLAGTITLEVAE
jgi:hypothetical protein